MLLRITTTILLNTLIFISLNALEKYETKITQLSQELAALEQANKKDAVRQEQMQGKLSDIIAQLNSPLSPLDPLTKPLQIKSFNLSTLNNNPKKLSVIKLVLKQFISPDRPFASFFSKKIMNALFLTDHTIDIPDSSFIKKWDKK